MCLKHSESNAMDDDIYVAGGVEVPDHMLSQDVVHFDNAPDDDLSRLLLQLIGLNLKRWNDDQKCQIIAAIHTILGIQPFKTNTIHSCPSSSLVEEGN